MIRARTILAVALVVLLSGGGALGNNGKPPPDRGNGKFLPTTTTSVPATSTTTTSTPVTTTTVVPSTTTTTVPPTTSTTTPPTTTTMVPGGPPAYLVPVFDSTFSVWLTRVTDWSGPIGDTGRSWDDRVRWRHHYSSAQAWNADSSLLFLEMGRLFLDGTTFLPLNLQAPSGLLNWSTTDPNIMIATNSSGVVLWNVQTGSVERSIPLPGYTNFSFQVRTSPSNDGSRVGVKARQSSGEWVCLGVDLDAGQIGQAVSFDQWNFSLGGLSEDKARRCGVTPSGGYLFLNGYANGSYNDQAHFFDWDTGSLVHKQRDNGGVECPGGHGDLGVDSSGRDVFVGVCKGGGEPWSDSLRGKTVALRIADGNISAVGPYFSHTTCRNTARPGWCYGSYFGSNPTIAAFSLDGQSLEYYAEPKIGPNDDYYDEPHAVPSPDGSKIVFASSWGGVWSEAAAIVIEVGR